MSPESANDYTFMRRAMSVGRQAVKFVAHHAYTCLSTSGNASIYGVPAYLKSVTTAEDTRELAINTAVDDFRMRLSNDAAVALALQQM